LLVHSHTRVARVLQKKHADPNEPSAMLGGSQHMHRPYGRQRKSRANTEPVNAVGHIKHKDQHERATWKVPSHSDFAWRCRSPIGRAWQPREFSRSFADCLCPRRRASEAMSTLARHVRDRHVGGYGSWWGEPTAESVQDPYAVRQLTASPSPCPSAFCSLAWRGRRLSDDETAGVVPWCDCASGQRLFRLSSAQAR
jgi:hypothetical protein